jgi:hypothetical protein
MFEMLSSRYWNRTEDQGRFHVARKEMTCDEAYDPEVTTPSGAPSRVSELNVTLNQNNATAGFTVRSNGPDGEKWADYWLSIRQNADGTLSVRAWRESKNAPDGEQIEIGNPGPRW